MMAIDTFGTEPKTRAPRPARQPGPCWGGKETSWNKTAFTDRKLWILHPGVEVERRRRILLLYAVRLENIFVILHS